MIKILFGLVLVAFVGCSMNGPRSETMCWNDTKAKYVKCPEGFKPGQTIR